MGVCAGSNMWEREREQRFSNCAGAESFLLGQRVSAAVCLKSQSSSKFPLNLRQTSGTYAAHTKGAKRTLKAVALSNPYWEALPLNSTEVP